jgi:hypothetical protein
MPRHYRNILRGAALFLAVGSLGGCRGHNFFAAPGPMNIQQANAVVHDPFPQNDIAPYEAASRPPSYQQPLPEPVRNRIVPDHMPWLNR